jgi:DNA polymerase III delta subunit
MADRGSSKKTLPKNWLLWATDGRYLEAPSVEWGLLWGGEDGVTDISAADAGASMFTNEVRSLPMWRDVQVVRLRHADQSSPEMVQAIAAYLDSPSEKTALLIEFVGNLGRPSAAWKNILGRIKSRGCTPRSARDLIREKADGAGFTIKPEAVSALEDWASGDFGKLASAIDLLFVYKAEEGVIAAEDLERLLGAGGAPRQWDVQDAFLKKDKRTFVHLVHLIQRDGDAVPLAVLGMMAKQFRALLLFYSHRARGVPVQGITAKMLGLNYDWQARKLKDTAGRWPESRVRETIGRFYDLDLALKGAPGEPWAILERHLLHAIA